MWCPECRESVAAKYDAESNTARCSTCGSEVISAQQHPVGQFSGANQAAAYAQQASSQRAASQQWVEPSPWQDNDTEFSSNTGDQEEQTYRLSQRAGGKMASGNRSNSAALGNLGNQAGGQGTSARDLKRRIDELAQDFENDLESVERENQLASERTRRQYETQSGTQAHRNAAQLQDFQQHAQDADQEQQRPGAVKLPNRDERRAILSQQEQQRRWQDEQSSQSRQAAASQSNSSAGSGFTDIEALVRNARAAGQQADQTRQASSTPPPRAAQADRNQQASAQSSSQRALARPAQAARQTPPREELHREELHREELHREELHREELHRQTPPRAQQPPRTTAENRMPVTPQPSATQQQSTTPQKSQAPSKFSRNSTIEVVGPQNEMPGANSPATSQNTSQQSRSQQSSSRQPAQSSPVIQPIERPASPGGFTIRASMQQKRAKRFTFMHFVGYLLCYGGVLALTCGSGMVLWSYYGGPQHYGPLGGLALIAGQMLFFLGLMTVTSSNMEALRRETQDKMDFLHAHFDEMSGGGDDASKRAA